MLCVLKYKALDDEKKDFEAEPGLESIDGFNTENAAVFNKGILQQQEEKNCALMNPRQMSSDTVSLEDQKIEENTNKEQPNAAMLQKGVLQQQQQENSLISANSNIWNVETHESMQDIKIEEHSNKMEQNKAINGSRDTQIQNGSVMSKGILQQEEKKGILSHSIQSSSSSNIYSINNKVPMVEFSEKKDAEIEENASKEPQNESQSKSFLDGLSALDLSGDSDAFWKAF